ncbi:MAG: hypothetical protein ACRC5T_10395 [Cetobacterium sp.]
MEQYNNTYISNRLETLLGKIEELNLDIINEDYLSSINRNYLDISTDGTKISYIRTERLYLFDGDFYNETLRKKYATQGKPGSVMQVVLSRDINYVTHRKITLAFLKRDGIRAKVVCGSDIAKYYNKDTYASIEGELGDSCMRKCPSSFFEIYSKYCDMVILVDSNDKIYARSVIFRGCILGVNDVEKGIMSRIYAVSDVYKDWLIEWGLKNDLYIFNGRFNDNRIIVEQGKIKTANELKPYFLTESLVTREFGYLPYLDNLQQAFILHNGISGIAFSAEDASECEKSELISLIRIDSVTGDKGTANGETSYCNDCSFVCDECHERTYDTYWEMSTESEDLVFDPCETCSEDFENCEGCIHD